jgi:dTDP-4-amino-4,6-dideoxygalactose transaminase
MHMKVPLLDLKAQYATIKDDIDAAVAAVFESQYFINGPEVTACEEAVAAYANCAAGVGVSSGTDALLLALMVEGIGAGDEVITVPYTFFATAGSIARTGARPVFVDIDPLTFNMDVEQIEAAITGKTKAIMPVHLYGQVANMERIVEIAEKHGLVVIEDGAQAIGAERKGRRAGSMGDYGTFSFFPSKNLGGAGDGGMVVTQSEAKAERLRIFRNHGSDPKYYHAFIGGNFRLDALQAAVVRVKLRHLDAWTQARQANAARYDGLFSDAGLAGGPVRLPKHPGTVGGRSDCSCRHIFNQYVLRCDHRDALRAHLAEAGIGTEIYYPVPMHLQACFADLGYGEGDFPESETAAKETVAIPVYPELSGEQARSVVDAFKAFYP